jgi:hypothetical protein
MRGVEGLEVAGVGGRTSIGDNPGDGNVALLPSKCEVESESLGAGAAIEEEH